MSLDVADHFGVWMTADFSEPEDHGLQTLLNEVPEKTFFWHLSVNIGPPS
jgi:hypothetical protein